MGICPNPLGRARASDYRGRRNGHLTHRLSPATPLRKRGSWALGEDRARTTYWKSGAPGGIRTPDPLIRSQMLYPLSYGRTVSSQVHAQIEYLIRCHDSERRPTQYTASI